MAIVAKYCLCGAALRGRVSSDAAAAGIAGLFDEVHVGPGCGEATPARAAAARRREELAAIRQTQPNG